MGAKQTKKRIERIALVQMCRENINWSDLGLGAGALKAYIQKQRPDVYDIQVFRSTDFIQRSSQTVYDLVGISAVSHFYDAAKSLAQWVRQNAIAPLVIIGGPHITCAPESITECFDFGVTGEGEQTLLEFLEVWNSGRTDAEIAAIPGIIAWQCGAPRISAQRSLLEDLDALPIPDLDVFKDNRAIPSIILSRGCPFHCNFCISHAMWHRKVRNMSPEGVVHYLKEMNEALGNLKVNVIKDDIAFIDAEYLRKVIEAAKKIYPQLLEIPKVGYARADIFTREFAQALVQFGFYKVVFGLESGSDRILSELKGSRATVQKNQAALDVAQEAGLVSAGHFIVGVPNETAQDLRQTYQFIMRNLGEGKLPSPTTTMLTPFPGTKYWQTLLQIEPGITLQNFRWERLEENGYASYYSETKGSIDDWWNYRQSSQKIYLGSMPRGQFIDILQEYEPVMIRQLEAFLAQDIRY
jgi:radical SAM superfamily enzyme YgiQ (UPF0313 family)